MQLQDALDKFIRQLEADGRSKHTIRQYQRHVRALSRWLDLSGHTGALEDIDHELLARFLASPAARRRPDGSQKKASSVNALRSSVKVFFSYLHSAGYISESPARLIRRALCGKPPPRSLSQVDQERLLKAMAAGTRKPDRRDHMLFGLMLASGVRLGSALGLDVEDVDLDRGELLLRRAKGDREERVFLSRIIRQELRAYIERRSTGPLFRSCGDRRLSHRQAQKRFSMWLQLAGIKGVTGTHTLRHTLATKIYRATRDVLLVKAALGHRNIESSLVYAQVDESQLRRALEA